MRPFALRVGLRRSVETSSWRYAFGSAQSHSVMTTLRSRPCGRGGAGGSSPAAVRSVQSANSTIERVPSWVAPDSLFAPACPERLRRSQAAREDSKRPSEAGISRVALLLSWWQAQHLPYLRFRSHSD